MATPNGYICRICNKPGHLIQQCPVRFQKQVPANYICNICGRTGHWIQQCPLKVNQNQATSSQIPSNYICNICGKQGHWIQQCPMKNQNQQTTSQIPSNYVCKICQKPGHLIQHCPMKAKQNQSPSKVPDNYVCNICGKQGHWIQQCPMKDKAASSMKPAPNYICKICNKPGHWIKDCPNQQVPDNYICNICKKPGHWIQQCPMKDLARAVSTQLLPSNYICKICNNPGHWIKDCPNKNKTEHKSNVHNNNSHIPPPNYICNKCRKPGHWIKDCKAQFFVAPTGYKCRICNIAGHWKEQCPQKDMDKLSTLSEAVLRQIAKEANMSMEDIEIWVEFIKDEQWKIIRNIDNAINSYYEKMEIKDYKDSNGHGKFLKHFKCHNLQPNVFIYQKKLYNLCENDNDDYVGWDENFPFIFRVGETDRNILMLDLIKTCFDGCYMKHKHRLSKMAGLIGLQKRTSYHIELDEYCVDSEDKDLNIKCKYCSNPGLYHRYLVDGYIKRFNSDLYIPSDITALIILFFDINSMDFMTMNKSFINGLNDVKRIRLSIMISNEGKKDRIVAIEIHSNTVFSMIKRIILTKESMLNEVDNYRLESIRSEDDILGHLSPKDYNFNTNQMLFLSRI